MIDKVEFFNYLSQFLLEKFDKDFVIDFYKEKFDKSFDKSFDENFGKSKNIDGKEKYKKLLTESASRLDKPIETNVYQYYHYYLMNKFGINELNGKEVKGDLKNILIIILVKLLK